MALIAGPDDDGPRSPYRWHDVRFIGAISGRYALPERREDQSEKVPVYACRLCSISTRMLVAVGPVVGAEGELISAHFDEFGLLPGRVTRRLPSGFVMELMLGQSERDKLGARIEWQKKRVHAHVPDKREHKRILPREPRSVITLADGQTIPCLVIDISQSGAAVSAALAPALGTAMAVGRIVGRVARRLELGFALQFVHVQPLEQLEALLVPPTQ